MTASKADMQRVMIVGISGAGKSTFARALAARTGLPLIHLDREFWRPGWRLTSLPEWQQKVAEMAARERWIIDGNYGRTLDLRLARADTVFWFDRPRLVALARVAKRVATGYGTVRPDMAPGCPERFDREFVRYVWTFNDRERRKLEQGLSAHAGHAVVHRLANDRDARDALAAIAPMEAP